jgi:glycosyltransferase involved in cell wall biosynthesis
MRLLFAHDHRFFRGAAGEYYSTGCLPGSVWSRYLKHFDELRVVARDEGLLPEGAQLAPADHPGVSFEFLPNLSSVRQLAFRSADAESRMSAAVESADAVIARLPSEIGLLAVRQARRLGKPYAVEVVGCAWDGYFNNGALGARLYAPLAFARMRRAVAGAPLALYVTSQWLQRRYPMTGDRWNASNVELLPLGRAASRSREERLEALKGGARPVLGTIASLRVKSKGIQTAFAALSQLRKDGLDLNYRLIGPGSPEPWQRLAEKLGIADLVHFDGTRSAGAGVCAWLDEIDIHLQPSFQEGLPRGTIEAMSRGVACIGSTCGGIPELLPPERIHKPGDVVALIDRIRRLATDPAAVAAASRQDRETALQFDPAGLRERRDQFYSRLRAQAQQRRPR